MNKRRVGVLWEENPLSKRWSDSRNRDSPEACGWTTDISENDVFLSSTRSLILYHSFG